MFARFFQTATLALAVVATTSAKAADQGVQTLGNFPALQTLSSNPGALRSFVKRIAAAYAKAGYDDFAPEFRRSAAGLISQYEFNADGTDLKAARLALRRLEKSLKKDNFLKAPASPGETLPNYHDLAAVFVVQAKVALKNVALGKNPANSLRNKKAVLWLTNVDGKEITARGGYGTLTYYPGVITTNTGNFLPSLPPSFNGGSVTLDSPLLSYWIAFLPDAEIPADLSERTSYLVEADTKVNDIDLPAGTHVYLAPWGYTAPDDAIILTPKPAILTVEHSSTPLPTTSYYTTPSVGNGQTIRLNGTPLVISKTSGKHWIAFPEGLEIPTDLRGGFTVTFTQPYLADGIAITSGTSFYEVNDGYVAPEGALVFPSETDLTITPAASAAE